MNYWKVAAGNKVSFWEECIGNEIIFYDLEDIKDCRKFDSDEQIIDLGWKNDKKKYTKDLVLFYRRLKIGDQIVLYGKKSIIALGEIIGDYEYSKKYFTHHIRRVEWKKIYGLNLFRSDFLPRSLEKKLQRNTTFIELTKNEWNEIEEYKIEGKRYPISIERDIQLNVASNLEKIKKGLKLYSFEYPIFDKKFETWKRIDVFAYDDNNDLYIIETKKGYAGIKALEQTLNYMKLVKKQFIDFKEIHGIIIAYDFKEQLKQKLQEKHNIRLIRYSCKFEFKGNVKNDKN